MGIRPREEQTSADLPRKTSTDVQRMDFPYAAEVAWRAVILNAAMIAGQLPHAGIESLP